MMINNKPAYANDYRYIVARNCDGELGFGALGMNPILRTRQQERLMALSLTQKKIKSFSKKTLDKYQ